ncbi:MFS domain-containing protein [Pseudohyphozyma bogoriensis]|nr:MFS domain-containing protein [Pseudohyphozyma bogoriensis]
MGSSSTSSSPRVLKSPVILTTTNLGTQTPMKKEVVLDLDLKEPSAVVEAIAKREGVTPVFYAKVDVINKAISEIGMGPYQWKLFIATGFGWLSDNLWLQTIAISTPQIAKQTGWPSYPHIRLATLAVYVGLIIGVNTVFWIILLGPVSRRDWKEGTAGAAPNFATFGVFAAFIGFGVDHEAVAVIHRMAKANGVKTSLTVADLHDAALPYFSFDDAGRDQFRTRMSTLHSIQALFATRRLAYSTSLVIFICGVLGSIVAALLVQWSKGGRRFAMSFFTVMAGVFLFGLTTARTRPNLIIWNCLASSFENAFYGVLYGYAPEIFPTPSRATGDALAAGASRITGLFAPIIVIYSGAGRTPNGPVYAAAAIFIFTGLFMLGLPLEPRGTTAL